MLAAFYSSGNRFRSCWPLTWIVPVLGAGTGLGATTEATVVADAIEIDPAPPVPGVSEAFDRTSVIPPQWRNDRGPTIFETNTHL